MERWEEWPAYLEWTAATGMDLPVVTIESLLDNIENVQLFQLLQSTDRNTLQIILLKLEGYSNKEIARMLAADVHAINMRLYRLRKKLKKYF